jgi:bacillopeptidase F (M6 metalloprotease family)
VFSRGLVLERGPDSFHGGPRIGEVRAAGRTVRAAHGFVLRLLPDREQLLKRLTRTIDLTGQGSGSLSFWVSYNTEQDWDFVFVEAHTVGQDDWTTRPDTNGHTGTSTGESCPAGWFDLHSFLAHYQTLNADTTCSPTGTTGSWNAASGSSGGWQPWSVDLSHYVGKQVEVSIAYVSDWVLR